MKARTRTEELKAGDPAKFGDEKVGRPAKKKETRRVEPFTPAGDYTRPPTILSRNEMLKLSPTEIYKRRCVTHGKPAILAKGLEKSYGKTRALAGLDLEVEEGTVFGLLGPNGAGKTTAVRILTTLLRPDAGRAEVVGLDVVGQADTLRSRIGLTGQYAAVDEYLTGRENLEMVGRLYHLPRSQARKRADELLERFELVGAASRLVKTYSGGMRRRLDLAASLVFSPPVLFLDEPTTGLDPRSRLAMWDIIGELVAGGTTVLLTTQYLDEADRLADRIAVVDTGRVIAEGTADELKARVGGERLEVVLREVVDLDATARVLDSYACGSVRVDAERRHASATVEGGAGLLAAVIRDLDAAGVQLDDLSLHRPTLDDVFLALTGRPTEATGEERPDSRDAKEVA